jgi:hypothetical protein
MYFHSILHSPEAPRIGDGLVSGGPKFSRPTRDWEFRDWEIGRRGRRGKGRAGRAAGALGRS